MSETHLNEIRVDPLINKEEVIQNNQPQELKMDETLGNNSSQKNGRSLWLASIMREVNVAKNNQPLGPKIPKVPDKLRNKNKECYSPLVVSIGPYHYLDRHNKLEEMEVLKVLMARQFILDSGEDIKLVYSEVEKVIPTAREFYNEIDVEAFNDEQFAQMMFLDGCFILQFIHRVTHNHENLEMSDRQVVDVKRDLLLLENQLPFPVLQSLMRMRYEKDETNHGMKLLNDFLFFQILKPTDQPLGTRRLLWPGVRLLLIFLPIALPFVLLRPSRKPNYDSLPSGHVNSYSPVFLSMTVIISGIESCILVLTFLLWSLLLKKGRQVSRYDSQWQPNQHPAHLLELLYSFFVCSHKLKGNSSPSRCGNYLSYLVTCLKKLIPAKSKSVVARASRGHYLYYSAKELKNVGVHFMSSRTCALTDVKFKSSYLHGTLELPSITIDLSTKSMLFNLVAYEASAALNNKLWVTSYICFMDSLIDDADDVKELRSKGILNNFHGPDQQVADLFNHMGSFLEPDTSVYNDVKRGINKQCESIVKKWVAESQQTYFRSPWAFIAFAGAAVSLALTATQTYYAMHPPKKN